MKSKVSRWANFDKKQDKTSNKAEEGLVVLTHTFAECQFDIIIPDHIPEYHGQFLLILDKNNEKGNPLVLQAPKKDRLDKHEKKEKNENKQSQQISILRPIAELFQFEMDGGSRINVKIQKLKEPANYELSFVEIDVKDQFCSRRDQQNINQFLQDTAVYTSKIIYFQGLKVTIALLMVNKGKGEEDMVNTGIITKGTTIVFRSLSSQMTFLIEVSKEVLDVDNLGEIYYEKIQRFLRVFFQKNLYLQTSHQYTIVLFARLFYPQFKSINELYQRMIAEAGTKNYCFTFAYQIDKNGVIFQDVYRSIKIKKSWNSWEKNTSFILKSLLSFLRVLNWKIKAPKLLEKITSLEEKSSENPEIHEHNIGKKEELEFASKSSSKNILEKSGSGGRNNILSKSKSEKIDDEAVRRYKLEPECELASCSNSNILEAINLIIEDYKKSYLGRSLVLTGQTIVLITCGDAQYYVDKDIMRVCKHNLLLNNIFCNVISFNRPPLFQTPCFVQDKTKMSNGGLIRTKTNIYSNLIYNCLELNWREDNLLYEAPLKILEDSPFKSLEGIFYDDATGTEKTNLKLLSNDEIFKFFKTELKCNHREHYIINTDEPKSKILDFSHSESSSDKNPFHSFSPYWLKSSFLTEDYFQGYFQLHDNLYSISGKFKINEKSFQPITSLGKILRSLDFNPKNIPGVPYNPLDRKIADILKSEKNVNEDSESNDSLKKFQLYNLEVFQFRKNTGPKTVESLHNLEETKLSFPEKGSKWTTLKVPGSIDKNMAKTEIVVLADEKKEEKEGDNSLKGQNLMKTDSVSSYQLGFNLFEVRNYDKKTFNNENVPLTEGIMHKTSSQNDFFKNTMQFPSLPRHLSNHEDSKKQKIHSHYRNRWKYFKSESKAHTIVPQYLKKKFKLDSHIKEEIKIEPIWKDLLMPGLAPLKSIFFPKDKNMNKFTYSRNPTKGNLNLIFEEAIAQRLAQNFQIVDDASLDYYGDSTKVVNTKTNKTCRLSFGNTHHKLIRDDLRIQFEMFSKHSNDNKVQERGGSDVFDNRSGKFDSLPILYKYLVFEDRVGHFTRNSYYLRDVKSMDWKFYDDFLFGYTAFNSTIKDLKACEPKTIKLRLIYNEQFQVLKDDRLSTEQTSLKKRKFFLKVKEKFECFFTALEEKMQKWSLVKKMQTEYVEKRKDIQEKYSDPNLDYYALYENILVPARSFQSEMSEKDDFYFEYQKFWCPRVSYHMNIYWLACSSQTINDFIKMLITTAKSAGFFVFYFPYNAPHYQSKSPFETVITIRMHPKTRYYLRKCIDKEPFFFVYDPEKEIKRFIHKKALIFIEFEQDRIHWRENHHNMDGEEGMLFADSIFENLNKYVMVIDLVRNILVGSLSEIKLKNSQSANFFLDESFLKN